MEIIVFNNSGTLDWYAFCYNGTRFRLFQIKAKNKVSSKQNLIEKEAIRLFNSETQYSTDSNFQNLAQSFLELLKLVLKNRFS